MGKTRFKTRLLMSGNGLGCTALRYGKLGRHPEWGALPSIGALPRAVSKSRGQQRMSEQER